MNSTIWNAPFVDRFALFVKAVMVKDLVTIPFKKRSVMYGSGTKNPEMLIAQKSMSFQLLLMSIMRLLVLYRR
jgi:hypothetical protein